MSNKQDLYIVRDMVPGDKNFILATWLRGLRFGNDWFGLIDSRTYFETYHNILERLLAAPGVQVRVACMKDDADVIFGYSVYKNDRLDWIFVKSAWRGIGVGKALMPDTITKVSHVTKLGASYLREHPGIIFDPFSLSK